jgi:acetylornithine deacetylase
VSPFAGVIRDQRIYGRGATDMKGFLAVVLANVPREAPDLALVTTQ